MAMASAELMAYCYGELAAAYARCASAARGAALGEPLPLHDSPVVFEQPKVSLARDVRGSKKDVLSHARFFF